MGVARTLNQYGLEARAHTAVDGTTFETHWVENLVTGQRVEFKTKFG